MSIEYNSLSLSHCCQVCSIPILMVRLWQLQHVLRCRPDPSSQGSGCNTVRFQKYKFLTWTLAQIFASSYSYYLVPSLRAVFYDNFRSLFIVASVQDSMLYVAVYAWMCHLDMCDIQVSDDEARHAVSAGCNEIVADDRLAMFKVSYGANMATSDQRYRCCKCCRTWSTHRILVCVLAVCFFFMAVSRVLDLALYNCTDKCVLVPIIHAITVGYAIEVLTHFAKKVRSFRCMPNQHLPSIASGTPRRIRAAQVTSPRNCSGHSTEAACVRHLSSAGVLHE